MSDAASPGESARRDAALRAVAVLVLLAALFGMAVHYDTTRLDGTEGLVTKGALAADPTAYDGETVYVWLDAARVDGRTVYTEPLDGEWTLAVETDTSVSPGDVFQASGTFDATARRLVADRVVVHDGSNRLRMYAVSVVGGLLAVGAFLRRWRVEWRTLTVVPRGRNGGDGRG